MQNPHEPSQRQLRVGEVVRHALVAALERAHFRDPVLAQSSVTVTEVRMSPDLRHATAFVVPFGQGDGAELVKALNRAAAFLRHQIAPSIQLRVLPDLHFREDVSFGHAARIDALLRSPEVARDLEPPAPPKPRRRRAKGAKSG
jgi:ribosome-binding factor A